MRGRRLALTVAGLLCAGCGSGVAASHAPAGQWLVQTSGRPAAATAPAEPGAAATAAARSSAGPRGATPVPGAGAIHPATASAPPAATPGSYPATGSYTQTSSTQPTPSQTSGSGTLAVAAPQLTAAGSEEDETYRFGGNSLTVHDVFATDGSVLVSRSGDAAFSPALPVVPAGLHDGMTWGPVSFTSGGASGTLSGSAGSTTQTTVGGVVVRIVPITLHLTLSGSFHGTPYTATSDESLSWAPSLHLAVHVHMVTDAQYATAGKYHSVLDVSLLSTRPE
ncbi:MAG TPA: hypothetical protein VFC09_09080 [Candidatus Dormibacteraeota bacterium]|nr:hypothetical protein [Candidatus Dormibacteraeota bacterium]